MGGCSGAAGGTKPPWERSRGSAGVQGLGLPSLEAEHCSSHTAGDLRQIPEDTGPFIVGVLGSSHTPGSAQSHSSWAVKEILGLKLSCPHPGVVPALGGMMSALNPGHKHHKAGPELGCGIKDENN